MPDFGRFVTRGVISRGGMGVVHRAHDPELHRDVAIHVLSDSPDLARVEREARAMAKLSHPNVVQVYDTGEANGERYIVTELVEGITLRAWLDERRRPWREVVDVFVACGRGLAAAHAAGLLHRDFKAENVLVGADGRPQVANFGLVATGDDDVDARDDQRAFCAALSDALRGDRRAPAFVEAALRRGMSTDRVARWPTMNELVDVLAPSRRRRVPILIAAIVGVVAVAAVAFIVMRGERADQACPDPAARLAGVWDAAVAARVKAAFIAASPAAGEASAERVIAKLDRYAEAWRAAADDACHTRQSAQLLDARVVCLDRRLAELRALSSALATADRARVNGAIDNAGALVDVATCADQNALEANPPPTDPEMRRRVAEVDAQIATSDAMKFGNDPKARQALATAAVDSARAIGYLPLLLRALEELEAAAEANGVHDVSEAALRELTQKAPEGHDDVLAANAWVKLMGLLAQQHQRDEAAALDPVAEAAVVRAGSTPMLRFALAGMRGARHMYANELDDSIAAFESSVELAPDDIHRIAVLRGLAQAVNLRDGPKAALPILEKAVRECETAYGPSHPEMADLLDVKSQLLMLDGDIEHAAEAATASLAIREATLSPGHADIGMALHQLANVERYRDPKKARPLYERALAIMEATGDADNAATAHAMLGTLISAEEGFARGRPHFEAGLSGLAATFGRDSLQYVHMEMNLAQKLIDADLCPEADPHIEHIITALEALRLERELPLPLIALFDCDIQAGRIDAAIAKLERGRAACAASACEFPEELAFELAKVLSNAHRDRARVQTLLDEAEKLARDNEATETLADIQAWRKSHR